MAKTKIISLDSALQEYHKSREKRVGRYSISSLWAMTNGYLPPEQYLEEEHKSTEDIIRIAKGIMWHNYLEQVLPYSGWKTNQQELKIEYPYKDFTLVGIPDGIKNDFVLEIKTSDERIEQVKPWHRLQVRAYLTLFNKKTGIVVQPEFKKNTAYLRVVGTVRRDDDWFFNKLLPQVEEYHQKLVGIIAGNVLNTDREESAG